TWRPPARNAFATLFRCVAVMRRRSLCVSDSEFQTIPVGRFSIKEARVGTVPFGVGSVHQTQFRTRRSGSFSYALINDFVCHGSDGTGAANFDGMDAWPWRPTTNRRGLDWGRK